MKSLSVQPSPRLLFGARGIDDLPDRLHSNYLKAEAERVLADADWLVRARPIAEGEGDTYQHGTRAIASQIQCLTAAWALTRDGRYRRAAVRHLSNLMNWNHISCEARPDTPAKKELPFCLSYGEHAADIALLYDLIRPDITDEEQQVFFDVLDRFYLKEALKCLDNPPWWAFKQWSNWNGVCAGGIGLLALSFYTDRPEAKKLIPFVEKSLGEYFKSFIENDGGCHEGTGYWNYGLHYAMRYVLSWETATGDRHPALSIREFKKGLYFPLDFSGISFGDNDGWHPSAYYFRLTERLNEPDAALSAATWLPDQPKKREGRRNRLDRCANGNLLFAADQIPTDEQMKRLRKQHAKKRQPVARVYDGLDWAALADDSAFPQLRLAARGGSSEISGHGMVDLLSFRCRYNGALMITDQQDGGYLSTTFTRRGHEMYGRRADSKSTLFVDGLGSNVDVSCDQTETVRGKGLLGIRIDASRIYLPRWKENFIGRLFLLVDGKSWLIIDRSGYGTWMESRFHTLARSEPGTDWVKLRESGEKMRMQFASLNDGSLRTTTGTPARPDVQPTTVYRWMSERTDDHLAVAALHPGLQPVGLEVEKIKPQRYEIRMKPHGGKTRVIHLSPTLRLTGKSQG